MLINIDPDTAPWYGKANPKSYWRKQDSYRLQEWKEELRTYKIKIERLTKGHP